ncbi:hypothetical protein V8C35DRAFT_295403 [Trichoderma chlorosporum]
MKFTLVLATFAAVVYGQSISDIPPCALPCIESAAEAQGCGATDVTCACAHFSAIEGASLECVVDACGDDVAINQVLPAVEALCPGSS